MFGSFLSADLLTEIWMKNKSGPRKRNLTEWLRTKWKHALESWTVVDHRARLQRLRDEYAGKTAARPSGGLEQTESKAVEAKPTKQASRDEINDLHRDYITHHWNCRTCIAAGQRLGDRCKTGLALWTDYSTAAGRNNYPWHHRRHARKN
jgi:hypothetical protein